MLLDPLFSPRPRTVGENLWVGGISTVQLYGLSPTLKSLHLDNAGTSIPEILGLICSFPLLEDLSLRPTFETGNHLWAAPPTSPKLTGSLRLHGKNRLITRRLLELPDGLHFSTIQLQFHGGDTDSRTMTDLVSKCSGTLKYLCLRYDPMSTSPLVSMVD